ncbi:eIF-2-alpha kinase GCN2 [Diplonema papillatum]|nr:eIF-2-alpha kinase GCN2 [Diplonema papillatum]
MVRKRKAEGQEILVREDAESNTVPCPICKDHIFYKETVSHSGECPSVSKELLQTKWVWGEANGHAENTEAVDNVEMVTQLFSGDPLCVISGRKVSGCREVRLRVLAPSEDHNGKEFPGTPLSAALKIRYGADWPVSAAIGIERTSCRIKHKSWTALIRSLAEKATEAWAADDERAVFVFSLVEWLKVELSSRVDCFMKEFEERHVSIAQDEFRPEIVDKSEAQYDQSFDEEEKRQALESLRRQEKRRLRQQDKTESSAKKKGNGSPPPLTPTKSVPNPIQQQRLLQEKEERLAAEARKAATKEDRGSPMHDLEEPHAPASESSASDGQVDQFLSMTKRESEASSTHGSESSGSSSSTPGKLADRWKKKPARNTGAPPTASSSSSSSSASSCGSSSSVPTSQWEKYGLPGTDMVADHPKKQKRRTKRAPALCSPTIVPLRSRHNVVALTPQERRQQILLRYLMKKTSDGVLRDAAVEFLEANGLVEGNVGDDKDLEAAVERLISETSGADRRESEPAADAPPPIKSWFQEHFEIRAALGKGGQGRVWQCQNLVDGLFYAVKRVELPVDHEADRHVKAEIRALARLRHPYIVRYFTAWFETEVAPTDGMHKSNSQVGFENFNLTQSQASVDTDCTATFATRHSTAPYRKFCYIQMEYCNQQTLRQCIKERIFTSSDEGAECGFTILRQLLESVDYLHKQRVIHRDLKPENIFFVVVTHTEERKYFAGDIKVGDFGLAAVSEDTAALLGPSNSMLGTVQGPQTVENSSGIGTPLYCAPEQEHQSSYTNKVDEYSVGIICFEMFSGFTEMERIRRIPEFRKTGKVPADWPGRRHPHLVEVVESLAALSAEKRVSAAEIIERGFLPKARQNEAMTSAIETFRSNTKTVEALFETCINDLSTVNGQDWLHQLRELSRYPKDYFPDTLLASRTQEGFKRVMTEIFSKAGAVELEVPSLFPANESIIASVSPSFRCMNDLGEIFVSLENWSANFAGYLAKQQPIPLQLPLRRYSFDKRSTSEEQLAMYDIVTTTRLPAVTTVADAELLVVVASILQSVAIASSKTWVLRLNHTDILRAILHVCNVSRPEALVDVLVRDKQSVPDIATALNMEVNMARRLVELIGMHKVFLSHDKSPVDLVAAKLGIKLSPSRDSGHKHHDIKGILASAPHEVVLRVSDALRDLRSLELVLAELNFSERYPNVMLEFDLMHAKDYKFYSGVTYEICYGEVLVGHKDRKHGHTRCHPGDVASTTTVNRSSVGMGGRYSDFLQKLRHNYDKFATLDKQGIKDAGRATSHISQSTAVCGMWLSLSNMATVSWQSTKSHGASARPSIFVCMPPGAYNMVALLRVTLELRDAGLAAEYQLEPDVQVATLQETSRKKHIPWILLIPQGGKPSSCEFKLINLSTGGLKKYRRDTEKEVTITASYTAIAKSVKRHLADSAPSGGPRPMELKVFSHDGGDLDKVIERAEKAFGSSLGCKACLSVNAATQSLRDVVAHLSSSPGSSAAPFDPKLAAVAEWIVAHAPAHPLLLLHSSVEDRFEVVVSANIGHVTAKTKRIGRKQGKSHIVA